MLPPPRLVMILFMLKRIALFALMILTLLAANARAEQTSFRSYQLPKYGSLQLSVPLSWNDQMRQGQPGLPPTILFTPERGYNFNVQITPLWLIRPDSHLAEEEDILRVVSKAAEEARGKMVDNAATVEKIEGVSGNGYYFSLSSKTAHADEFSYMTQGMLRVGGLAITFIILSNDGAEAAVADALRMMKNAREISADKH